MKYFKLINELYTINKQTQSITLFNNLSKTYYQIKQIKANDQQIIKTNKLAWSYTLVNIYVHYISTNTDKRINTLMTHKIKQFRTIHKQQQQLDQLTELCSDLEIQQLLSDQLQSIVQQLGHFRSIVLDYQVVLKQHKTVNQNLLQKIELYHECIENLIEGQREVMHDDQFEYDGKTVEERNQEFKRRLEFLVQRNRNNIEQGLKQQMGQLDISQNDGQQK